MQWLWIPDEDQRATPRRHIKNHPLIFDSCIKMSRWCIVQSVRSNKYGQKMVLSTSKNLIPVVVVAGMKWDRERDTEKEENITCIAFPLRHRPNTLFIQWMKNNSIFHRNACVFRLIIIYMQISAPIPYGKICSDVCKQHLFPTHGLCIIRLVTIGTHTSTSHFTFTMAIIRNLSEALSISLVSTE